MSVEHMPGERLAHFYENIRQQVEADQASIHDEPNSSSVCRQTAKRDDQTTIKAFADRMAVLAISALTTSIRRHRAPETGGSSMTPRSNSIAPGREPAGRKKKDRLIGSALR